MRRTTIKRITGYVLGFTLIGLGVLGLMEYFALLQAWETTIATAVFLAGSAGFLGIFGTYREDWWAATRRRGTAWHRADYGI